MKSRRALPAVVDKVPPSGEAFDVLADDLKGDLDACGDGAAYDRHRVLSELRFYQARLGEAMIEAGKRLILIQAHESRPDFEQLLAEMGVSSRTARRWIAATRRFLSMPEKARSALAAVPQSKMITLFDECEDAALLELAEGGSIDGVTLGDIRDMSVRELVRKLADTQSALTARQRIIDGKQQQCDELRDRLEHAVQPSVESLARNSQEQKILETMRGHLVAAEGAIFQLAAFANDAHQNGAPEFLQVAARQSLELLAQRVADLVNTHGVRVDLKVAPNLTRFGKRAAAQ